MFNDFEISKKRDEKIDGFLDNLTRYFSPTSKQDLTAKAVTKLTEEIKILYTIIKKADESSIKLANALNKLTFWGVLVAAVGVFVALIQFLYNNFIWPFSQ